MLPEPKILSYNKMVPYAASEVIVRLPQRVDGVLDVKILNKPRPLSGPKLEELPRIVCEPANGEALLGKAGVKVKQIEYGDISRFEFSFEKKGTYTIYYLDRMRRMLTYAKAEVKVERGVDDMKAEAERLTNAQTQARDRWSVIKGGAKLPNDGKPIEYEYYYSTRLKTLFARAQGKPMQKLTPQYLWEAVETEETDKK